MSVVKVLNVSKEYRSKNDATTVLRNFNMNVAAKTIYSIMGPSGCGKTTVISSLVGIATLDSGTIEVFGEPPTRNRHRIGYMPQENALVKEFSIREMVWFFGTIFGMTAKKINERFEFLSDLLELPEGNTIIKDCSGGQQRRVSFAMTLVHEPELLILDEPTVGLDPLLRVKIWDYLLDITSKQQATVLLSTHYIEEARLSTHIGLMRNGVLVAEDSPQKILNSTKSLNLEEAFLKLSEVQRTTLTINETEKTTANSNTTCNSKENTQRTESTLKQSDSSILYALVVKNFLQLYRNLDVPLVAILLPLWGCIQYSLTINPINDIPLGIVNHEVPFQADCANVSRNFVQIDGMDCQLHKLSCKIIEALPADMFDKKFYSDIDEAFKDAKKGKLAGVVHFTKDFTELTPLMSNDEDESVSGDNGEINVYLDNTNHVIAYYTQITIRHAFKKASEKEMARCGLNKDVINVPISFEKFDEKKIDLRPTFVTAFSLSTLFAIASYVLINTINYDQQEGIWDRCLAAGVKPVYFLISHLVEGLVILFGQVLVVATYLIFFMGTPISAKAAVLLVVLLAIVGFAGLTFGLMCSTTLKDPQNALYASQTIVYPVYFLSGLAWPLEGAPLILQYVGQMLPIALPVFSLRNIFAKDVNFTDPSYCNALLVPLAWTIVSLSICFWKMRERN